MPSELRELCEKSKRRRVIADSASGNYNGRVQSSEVQGRRLFSEMKMTLSRARVQKSEQQQKFHHSVRKDEAESQLTWPHAPKPESSGRKRHIHPSSETERNELGGMKRSS